MMRSLSSVEMKAPWSRIGSLFPGSRNSMSPLPSNASAPLPSRIVRLSTLEATRNAIRLLGEAGYRIAAVSDKGREYTFVRPG